VGAHLIRADQPAELGGSDSAPAPFDVFLASLATCAAIYVLGFCQARGLPTKGLSLTQSVDVDPASKLPRRIRVALTLPRGFPDQYRAAIIRAAESCKVKKTIASAPSFEVSVLEAPARPSPHAP
jgi:putative redox protein